VNIHRQTQVQQNACRMPVRARPGDNSPPGKTVMWETFLNMSS
jgi:hypothetical protein